MKLLAHVSIATAFALAIGASTPAVAAPKGPGIEALKNYRKGKSSMQVVQNRFFLKQDRFETSVLLGYAPTNQFATRIVGNLQFGYHFNEQLSAQIVASFSPPLSNGDLTGLTNELVVLGNSSASTGEFRQPLDKISLGFSANAVWAPLYGKINLLGEEVVNFDLYFVAGVGLNILDRSYAVLNEAGEGQQVVLDQGTGISLPTIGPSLGTGFNFFLTQSITLKLDSRFNFYVAEGFDYDPNDGVGQDNQLFTDVTLTIGLSFFFPEMKPRLFDF